MAKTKRNETRGGNERRRFITKKRKRKSKTEYEELLKIMEKEIKTQFHTTRKVEREDVIAREERDKGYQIRP